MQCKTCGKDSDTFVFLPAKKPDGSLSEMVCHDCALASPAYCEKHQIPHIGFADDETTACLLCIREIVDENKVRAKEIYFKLKTELPLEEISNLDDWANDVSSITGNTVAVCILRAIATKALRLKTGIDEVVKQVIRAKSVELILPGIF